MAHGLMKLRGDRADRSIVQPLTNEFSCSFPTTSNIFYKAVMIVYLEFNTFFSLSRSRFSMLLYVSQNNIFH